MNLPGSHGIRPEDTLEPRELVLREGSLELQEEDLLEGILELLELVHLEVHTLEPRRLDQDKGNSQR